MPRIPVPGQPVRGSKSGEPIMALLDLLGRHWSMRVVWELRGGEALSFRALQERCEGVSSSVLNDRLAELRRAAIVEQTSDGYQLAPEGERLLEVFPPLIAWAERWSKRERSAPGSGKRG